nr:E6 protein [Felis domesticus papillomavirus 2]
MSQADLGHFDYAVLQLTWKNNSPYGSCIRCLLASSRYERENYCTGVWTLQEWYGPLNGPLFQDFVRCLYCYAPLSSLEKLRLLLDDGAIYRIRGRFRAPCRLCTVLT